MRYPLSRSRALIRQVMKHPRKLRTAFLLLLTQGPLGIWQRIQIIQNWLVMYVRDTNEQYNIWFSHNFPTQQTLRNQKITSQSWKFRPLISIVTPVYNPNHDHLRQCIESVINQSYDHWELCLVDDASTDGTVRLIIQEYATKDKRIKYRFRSQNGHICHATNSALTLASGDFVAFLDHDDFLWPNALFEVVKKLNRFPQADLLYTDEDKIEEDTDRHVDPFVKPDWSPHFLRSINYITHFLVIRKALVDQVGGFRPGFEGSQDWDLILRVTTLIEQQSINNRLTQQTKIIHIPKILYSWRKSHTSTASEKHVGTVKRYAYDSQKKALTDDLKNRGFKGQVLTTQYLGLWRVQYSLIKKPMVSIIIPTKDAYQYIKNCLDSILTLSTYQKYEILIVDTGSRDPKIPLLYQKTTNHYPQCRIVRWNKPFNFAAVCNFGAQQAVGDHFIFLNNDTKIITPDWIEALLEHSQQDQIGAVGAQLLYADNTIQHAGIILGVGGVANHAMRHTPANVSQSFPMLLAKDSVRDVAAVTAACLMIKKRKFWAVNGFDENFRIAYNDVDLCLKLYMQGYNNIYTAFARLYHYENISVGAINSTTRERKEFIRENRAFIKKWQPIIENDPFYSPMLTRTSEAFQLAQTDQTKHYKTIVRSLR